LRARGGFTTDDTLATLLPLFRQVLDVHGNNRVAPLEGLQDLWVDGYRAYFEVARTLEPRLAPERLRAVEGRGGTLEVGQHGHETAAVDGGSEDHERLLVAKPGTAVEDPIYLPGYVSWEHRLGHPDALTDIYVLGLILASVSCGLDLT